MLLFTKKLSLFLKTMTCKNPYGLSLSVGTRTTNRSSPTTRAIKPTLSCTPLKGAIDERYLQRKTLIGWKSHTEHEKEICRRLNFDYTIVNLLDQIWTYQWSFRYFREPHLKVPGEAVVPCEMKEFES